MRRIVAGTVLGATLLVAGAGWAQSPFQQMDAETVQRLAGAVVDAVKGGKLAARGVPLVLAAGRAAGYRLGPAGVVFIPVEPPAADGKPAGRLVPLAVLLTRSVTVGDFRQMVPLNRAVTLSLKDGPQDLAAFVVAMRVADGPRQLEVYGKDAEPIVVIPARVVRAGSEPEFGLRLVADQKLELTYTVGGSVTAPLRLGPPDRTPAPAAPTAPTN